MDWKAIAERIVAALAVIMIAGTMRTTWQTYNDVQVLKQEVSRIQKSLHARKAEIALNESRSP